MKIPHDRPGLVRRCIELVKMKRVEAVYSGANERQLAAIDKVLDDLGKQLKRWSSKGVN